jgi:ATP-dependent DNA helicase PIF1
MTISSAPSSDDRGGKPLVDLDVPSMASLTCDQLRVMHAVNAGQHVFLTGCAGCGKTRTALALRDGLAAAGTAFDLTASTGVAAELLGGCTLHSLLCLRKDDEADPKEAVKRARRWKRARLQALRVLLIDEVSMLSAETLELALEVLRGVRGAAGLPVLVLVGDFLQLAPVEGTLALESPVWQGLAPTIVCLGKSFRQADDAAFVDLLNDVRVGRISEKTHLALQSRVDAPVVVPSADVKPTVLMALRNSVDTVNARHLLALPGDTVVLRARVYVASRASTGDPWAPVARSSPPCLPGGATMPAALVGLDVSVPQGVDHWAFVTEAAAMASASLTTTPSILTLRAGAQVMFTANLGNGIVNGTRGVVVEFVGGLPKVQLASGAMVVPLPVVRTRLLPQNLQPAARRRVVEDTSDLGFKEAELGPVLACAQVPLVLAWALTIHKCQGSCVTLAEISLNVFAKGQAYVALSRATSLDSITLRDYDPDSITADEAVVAWYDAHAPASQGGAGAGGAGGPGGSSSCLPAM